MFFCVSGPAEAPHSRTGPDVWWQSGQVTPWWSPGEQAWSQQVVTSATSHWHLDKQMRGKRSGDMKGGNALDVGFLLLVCAKSRMDCWTVQHTCVLTCVLSLNIVSLWHARMNVCGPCSALAHSSTGLTSPARPSPDMVVVIIKTKPSPLRNFSVSDTYWAGRCLNCRTQFIYCKARSSLIVSSHAFINRSWKLHRVLPYLEAWELGQVHHLAIAFIISDRAWAPGTSAGVTRLGAHLRDGDKHDEEDPAQTLNTSNCKFRYNNSNVSYKMKIKQQPTLSYTVTVFHQFKML